MKICKVANCTNNPYHAKGYCRIHYQRLRNTGKLEISRAISGAGYIDKSGYRVLNIDGKIIPEHRYLMERHLGRELLKSPKENIHHKNGNRLDNRIENLELWVIAQPSGQRPKDLVKYAKEILKQYDNLEEQDE